MEDKDTLIASVAHWMAAGKLEARFGLPALQQLAGQSDRPMSLLALLEVADAAEDQSFQSLAGHLRETLRQGALRVYKRRKLGQESHPEDKALLTGLSLETATEWGRAGDFAPLLESAIRGARELGFLTANKEQAPTALREVRFRVMQNLTSARAAVQPLVEQLSFSVFRQVEKAWPADLPGREAVLAQLANQVRRSREPLWQKAGYDLPPQPWPLCVSLQSADSPADQIADVDDEAVLKKLQERFASAQAREEKVLVLDAVCSWISPAASEALRELAAENWARDRALLNLILRFGQSTLNTWDDWLDWLWEQARRWREEDRAAVEFIQQRPLDLLLILYSNLPNGDPAVLDALLGIVYESGEPLDAQKVIKSWARYIPTNEQRALLGLPEPRPPPLPSWITGPTAVQGEQTEAPAPVSVRSREMRLPPPLPSTEIPAPPPPRPSIWEKHIQPVFVENWYIVAGIAMVILGSSLLAYYTWDKHWLVRYTIMPSLLGLFTWSLAGAGRWIEKKSEEFKTTASILRGAAIGLLPINFMAMALLSSDEKVTQKGPALLAMAFIYFSVFGWSLRNWCGAVEPALRNRLAGTLLLLNALVSVGPLAKTFGHLEGRSLLISLGTGFYLGFGLAAATLVYFTRRILTRQMAEEKRVPWFVASTLAITFLQVFVWVHGFMRHLPHPHTYALLVILIGWLVLHGERRALELRATPQLHGGESFLGFAFIVLGLLMGFTEPALRIACFGVAGAVWLYQAFSKRHPLHYWIALTLWALAVTSVGLLPEYPGPLLPLLGIGSALGFGLGIHFSQKAGQSELARACKGMQVASLFLTTLAAPLVQWHFASEPIVTAGWLVLAAGLLAWRAFKDQELRWLHSTMVVLALVLPYVGFVDMAGRTAHHNTMVFGLALLSSLWLLACQWAASGAKRSERAGDNSLSTSDASASSLILQARSTVLWFYGSLALAAMLLRLALGDAAPTTLWYRDFMDYMGPILMMLVLVPATFYSRSLVPAGMAVVLMAILFPELKANLQRSLPWISWGTGLESAIWGLALTWLCFFVRRWRFLQNLGEGDLFMGREPFPVRRYDHTLFTLPLMAAALFLCVKVDTWNALRNWLADGVGLKTAIALGITGVSWTFVSIYHRESRSAIVAVHLGWICALAGIGFGYWRQATNPYWTWPFLLTGLLLQGLYWLYRFKLQGIFPWLNALLTEPIRKVLLLGSALLAVASITALLGGASLERMQWLLCFVAVQLIWHGVRTGHPAFGVLLFFEAWTVLLALTASGPGALWERISVQQSLGPTLWLMLGIQLIFVLLEMASIGLREPTSTPQTEPGHEEALTPNPSPIGWERETGLGSATRSTGSVGKWPFSRIPIPARHGFLERATTLLSPSFLIASGLAVLLGLAGIVDGTHWLMWSGTQQGLALALLLLTARAHGSTLIAVFGALLGYLMLHRGALALLGNPESQFELLLTPWRAAWFGLGLALAAQAGQWLTQRKPRLLTGGFAHPFFETPSCGWAFWPAAIAVGFASIYHTFDPVLRESATQLWTPYLGSITLALIAFSWRSNGFFLSTGLLLFLGNIHLVRVFGGEFLRGHGLSELHLVCLGAGLTLLQASLLRRLTRATKATEGLNLGSLGLACLVLVLLSVNYFTEPNLAGITSTRFIVSGVLAWLAGWYFRRAARHPGSGEEAHIDLCESLYHFGMVLAIWCAALLVPWFRQPLFTLIALGLPVVWFYTRAEFGMRAGRPEARRYRNSAAVLGFVLLGLYVLKGVFQIVLFPGVPITTEYYHYNAPVIILLGVVLLRLHGLGGTSWLAFYGGVALMVGSYFLLTALPGLSPFDYPMPSAWCALGLGHFWILVSYARSPLRTLIQRLANLSDASWHSLRRSWGFCLLAVTQGMAFWGIADYASNTFMVAPLLAGAATILVHHGIARMLRNVASLSDTTEAAESRPDTERFPGTSALTFVLAGLELALALHMDFLIPSYLSKEYVIWAILIIWLLLLVAYQLAGGKLKAETVGQVALVLAVLVLGHICYHRPWSNVGLWGMAMAAVFANWNPQRKREAANAMEQFCGALLLWVPAWLTYFSQAPFQSHGLEGGLEAWPLIAMVGVVFLTGVFSRFFPIHLAPGYNAWPRSQFRLFDSTLTWVERSGPQIHRAVLWLTLFMAGAIQVAHYNTPFAPREIVPLVLMEAGLATAWFYEGKTRQSMVAYYLMQISALAFFASVRRQLMLTTGFWNYEYDVWASLVFSLALAGAKQVLDLQPKSARVPLLTTMLALPVIALVWVLIHGLGVNMALLVVGLHSVMFAYLGKNDRESPYNILALAGFVAFILVTFYSKLQLRAVHAYIIPTGLGVLVLQELFHERVRPETRNWIRLIALMAMLGSSGYYALADSRHAITFNLTMILLCLLAMGLGSFLRIRLYLAMGFAGLMVDLISLLTKVLVHMERSARMTGIGVLVLGIGAILVFGAIYYKTNKAAFDAHIDRWRGRLGQWE